MIIELKKDNIYHIYNRGINSCRIFNNAHDYKYFINLYQKHICPVANTYSWVLMPTHFHFIVMFDSDNPIIKKQLHQYFANMFNAYTKAFNLWNNRHGGLFERPFKRKHISNEKYLKTLLMYVHNNPVELDIVSSPEQYNWSSYKDIINSNSDITDVDYVLELLGGLENFKYMHEK